MSNKKSLYYKFLEKSRAIKDDLINKRVQNVIELLKNENKSESIKLLKYSLRETYDTKYFNEVIQILKSSQYPVSTWESFEFYFRLRDSLKKEYFCILSYLQELDSLILFNELNKMLIQYGENTQNIINFINEIFNYDDRKVPVSKFKRGIYKAKNLKKSKQMQITECFRSYNQYKITNRLIELFEYDFIDFRFIDNNVSVINNPSYDLNAINIANLDNEVLSQWQNLILHLNDEGNLFYLPPSKYLEIVEEELLKAFPLNKFLFLDEQIQGIPIKYWLKTFLLIYKENWKCIQDKESLLCMKSRIEWEEIFIDGGIEERYHSCIFKAISFTRCSHGKRNIEKYPFIVIENNIYTIPGIICYSDIVRVLISIFEDLENNLQFKGNYYEEFIREKWRKSGIKNVKKKEKILGDVFDCDMAFIFDEDLFICEIKNLLQPNSLHDWHRFYIKTQENLKQLERIANHYSESKHLKGMAKELVGRSDWLPKKVQPILIYSCYIGTIIKSKQALVTSEIDIYNFFARTPIRQYKISKEKKEAIFYSKYLNGYEYLENIGRTLTIADFEKYMECPMAIKYQKDRIKFKKKKIMLAGIWLWMDCVEVKEYCI
ncbi:hypothetical protein [Clostridium sp. UBA871]|uniref:hypothetical protein n=1 Tax=Clostridium sp. UBA871 TaxID=1946380 RepID=UPI003217584D